MEVILHVGLCKSPNYFCAVFPLGERWERTEVANGDGGRIVATELGHQYFCLLSVNTTCSGHLVYATMFAMIANAFSFRWELKVPA